MADRNVNTIVVQLIDKLTGPARQVERGLKGIKDTAKSGQVDLVGFNRALFATTAFVGTMQRVFGGMFKSIETGAELGRLTDQFERTLGPRGRFFAAIESFTDTSVDRIEALRAGVELANLGISTNATSIAMMLGKAATAAKRAGFDAGTGIKEYTAFLKDGSTAHLENIGLINRANMSLMVQQRILESSGGAMGGVIALQARYGLGEFLLTQRTLGLMHGHRDLADVVKQAKNAFIIFRQEIGMFLGTALIPVIDKVSTAVDRFSNFIVDIRKNHQGVLQLAKSFIVATGTLATFLTTAVVLKNVVAGIVSLGFGLGGFFKIFLAAAIIDHLVGLTNVLSGLSKFIQDVTHQLVVWAAPFAKIINSIAKAVNATYEWVTGTKLFIQHGQGMYNLLVKLTAGAIVLAGVFKAIAIGKIFAFGLLELRRYNAELARMAIFTGGARNIGASAGAAGFMGRGMGRGVPLLTGVIGAAQVASTAIDKQSSTKDIIASVVGDLAVPLAATVAGSFLGPAGTIGGAIAGQVAGQWVKTYISQTDRVVNAVDGVKDEISDNKTDNALPDMPTNQLDIVSKLADMYDELDKNKKAMFGEAFRQAVLPQSDLGKDISPQEFVKLQRIANGYLKDIRDTKPLAYSGSRKEGPITFGR